VDFTDGVLIPIDSALRYETIRETKNDKLVKISAVYVVGLRIDTMSIAPKDDSSSLVDPTLDNAKLIVTINRPDTTTIKLEPSKHYAIAYDNLDSATEDKTPYVVFTKDVVKGDPFPYSKNQEFYVDPTCDYAITNDIGEDELQIGTIFPHTRFKGILISDIWVMADLDTPSIVIRDPGTPDQTNANAEKIAQGLEYYIAPLVIVEPPAPIAYSNNGSQNRTVN